MGPQILHLLVELGRALQPDQLKIHTIIIRMIMSYHLNEFIATSKCRHQTFVSDSKILKLESCKKRLPVRKNISSSISHAGMGPLWSKLLRRLHHESQTASNSNDRAILHYRACYKNMYRQRGHRESSVQAIEPSVLPKGALRACVAKSQRWVPWFQLDIFSWNRSANT